MHDTDTYHRRWRLWLSWSCSNGCRIRLRKWYTICHAKLPTALIVSPTEIAVEVVHLQEQYVECVHLYCECKHVKKPLLRHVKTAVEETYLEELVDKDTSLVDEELPAVLECLFMNYGTVLSEEVKEKE